MEMGCQKNLINCCYCNCMNSIYVTIIELITSLLGTILNFIAFSFFKKEVKEKLGNFLSLNYINMAYFCSSSVLLVILFILQKLHKIEQAFVYKFGNYSTLFYSFISKIMGIANIIGFLYILGCLSYVIIRVNVQEAENVMPATFVGLHGIINVIYGTEGVELDCSQMECEGYEKKEEKNMEILNFYIICFSNLFSSLFLFINGASFSSQKQRTSYLIKGKLQIDFIPIESISVFDKKFCDFLNVITCYRMPILKILNLISIFSLISFTSSLITFILGLKNSWPQAIFFEKSIGTSIGLVLMILTFFNSLYCKNVECCSFNTPPSKRKCVTLMLLILVIIFFLFQLLSFTILFTSQMGLSKISLICTVDEPCDNLFTIYDYYMKDQYSFILDVKAASSGKKVLGFFLGITPPFCFFFLIVLMISYFRRAFLEYNIPNRMYDSILYSIEENGEKIDLNNIDIVCELTKIKRVVNNKEIEEDINIYHRKIKSNDVQNVENNLPVINIY